VANVYDNVDCLHKHRAAFFLFSLSKRAQAPSRDVRIRLRTTGMPEALLRTKLFIPQSRGRVVARSRLTGLILSRLDRKITLISATAGSGKTTLLAELSRMTETPVAWISLDPSDDDPARFAAYFVEAIGLVCPGAGEQPRAMLDSPYSPPITSILTMLSNSLTEARTSIILVLDDYHAITNEKIHEAVGFWAEHQPPDCHLIIASRTKPPLPLARLRARDGLTELRTQDLRFNEQEAAAFLNEVMELQLAPEAVIGLERRTEGWIAGLQLAALSLERGSTPAGPLEQFSGRNSYVLDFLVDEVLAQQSDAVKSFLLRTAILSRLNGSLCDAVTLRDDGNPTLRSLEEANLFLVPLDADRTWYRYHHLFSEFLLERSRESFSVQQFRELHWRAALWHRKEGLTEEAINHAIEAAEFETAAAIIEESADRLYHAGAITTLRRWLERLPNEVLKSRPRAAIYYAWVLFFAGEGRDTGEQVFARAEGYLQSAEQLLKNDTGARETLGIAYAVRTAMSSAAPVRKSPICAHRDLARTIECGQKALELLARDNLTWRCVVNVGLGFAYRVVGEVATATRAFAEASRLGHQAGNLSGAMFAFSNCAALLVAQGKLTEAERICQEALRAAAEHRATESPMTAQIHAALGRLYYEWNDLEQASRYFEAAIRRGEAMGFTSADLLLGLARTRYAAGDTARASQLEVRATQVLDHPHMHSHFESQGRIEQVRLALRKGDTAAATRIAKIFAPDSDDEPNPWRESELITFARALIGDGHADRALTILEGLLKLARGAGRQGNVIELLAVKASAHKSLGQLTEAEASVAEALRLAEPEGYVRTFVDEGESAHSLLLHAYQTSKKSGHGAPGISREYLERLLMGFKRAEPGQAATAHAAASDPPGLLEPFSEREIEVIRLLAAGRSNQEIADHMFVALSTVKWHINNIYGKLGVKSRTEAISRARRLGIV